MRYAPPQAPLAVRAPEPAAPPPASTADAERCEVCNAPSLYWRNCKQVCANCRTINKSCADL